MEGEQPRKGVPSYFEIQVRMSGNRKETKVERRGVEAQSEGQLYPVEEEIRVTGQVLTFYRIHIAAQQRSHVSWGADRSWGQTQALWVQAAEGIRKLRSAETEEKGSHKTVLQPSARYYRATEEIRGTKLELVGKVPPKAVKDHEKQGRDRKETEGAVSLLAGEERREDELDKSEFAGKRIGVPGEGTWDQLKVQNHGRQRREGTEEKDAVFCSAQGGWAAQVQRLQGVKVRTDS